MEHNYVITKKPKSDKLSEEREGSKHNKLFNCGYFDNANGDYVPKDSRNSYVFDILKDKI